MVSGHPSTSELPQAPSAGTWRAGHCSQQANTHIVPSGLQSLTLQPSPVRPAPASRPRSSAQLSSCTPLTTPIAWSAHCHHAWGCKPATSKLGPALLSGASPSKVLAGRWGWGASASLHTKAASVPAGARPQTQALNATRHVGVRTGSDRDTTFQNGLSSDLKVTQIINWWKEKEDSGEGKEIL